MRARCRGSSAATTASICWSLERSAEPSPAPGKMKKINTHTHPPQLPRRQPPRGYNEADRAPGLEEHHQWNTSSPTNQIQNFVHRVRTHSKRKHAWVRMGAPVCCTPCCDDVESVTTSSRCTLFSYPEPIVLRCCAARNRIKTTKTKTCACKFQRTESSELTEFGHVLMLHDNKERQQPKTLSSARQSRCWP